MDSRHGRMQAEESIEIQGRTGIARGRRNDANGRPQAMVGILAVRHRHIQAIPAAAQEYHHQHPAVSRRPGNARHAHAGAA